MAICTYMTVDCTTQQHRFQFPSSVYSASPSNGFIIIISVSVSVFGSNKWPTSTLNAVLVLGLFNLWPQINVIYLVFKNQQVSVSVSVCVLHISLLHLPAAHFISAFAYLLNVLTCSCCCCYCCCCCCATCCCLLSLPHGGSAASSFHFFL